ncbi:F-box/LRR-repeat protein 13 [Linum perenne]
MASDSVSDAQKVEEGLDWICKLPDELLVKVVSLCSLKDAIRTSVLSRRWRNLWKSADLALDFDATEELMVVRKSYDTRKPCALLASKRKWFKNWVNGVVRQLQQDSNSPHSRLTKFRVFFTMDNQSNSEGDIDRWLEFAISKRVESLDIAFHDTFTPGWEFYVFSQDCFNHIKTPTGLSQINHLKSLSLSRVNVTGEILEHLLANCTQLEHLAVKRSYSLKQLRVVGSSHSPLPLKYLELKFCQQLMSLKIGHAPRLVCFRFAGCRFKEDLQVGDCSSLVDMAVDMYMHPDSLFRSLSGCASQLVTLFIIGEQLHALISPRAEYTCLKWLGVRAMVRSPESILGLIPLINACPCLHTLQLNIRRASKWWRLLGSDCEFVEYVMEYFVGLERIVIDLDLTPVSSRESFLRGEIGSSDCSEEQGLEAKRIALGYKSKAPSKLQFIGTDNHPEKQWLQTLFLLLKRLDWISKLPDELIVKVVSLCSLKDAVRTSVLSRRWRNLWKSADLALDFDALEELIAVFDASEELIAVRMWRNNEWESMLARKRKWVVGSSHSPLPLKYFELKFCSDLESLKIDHTPHLVRFTYVETFLQEDLQVGDCPSLVDITLDVTTNRDHLFRSLSGCASQLVTLSLVTDRLCRPLNGMAEYTCLKWLGVRIPVSSSGSILGLIPFINACPRLHTLQLQLRLSTMHCSGSSKLVARLNADLVKLRRESIKVVEIVGFKGYLVDYKFVKYVLKYFVGLERIVLDRDLTPRSSRDSILHDERSGGSPCSEEQGRKAERVARRFKSRAPSTLEFIVI